MNTFLNGAILRYRNNQKDKADRATVEQVLDPRTRIILFKMLNRGIFYEINGCISTGKEVSQTEMTRKKKAAILITKSCL